MKKNTKGWIILASVGTVVLVGILVGAVLLVNFIRTQENSMTIVINWEVNLLGESRDVYYLDTGPSFFVDGPRLSIMEYPSADSVKHSVEWKSGPDSGIEANITDLLATLQRFNDKAIDPQYLPDFTDTYIYYSTTRNSIQHLYLLYDLDTDILYAVEWN